MADIELETEMNPEMEMERVENGAEPRVYELSFLIDAELPQEEGKKVYQSIKDLVSGNGTLVAEGEAEKIPLAYTISRMDTTGRRDFNSAYFGWVAYEAPGEGHAAIIESVKENTNVIRFLDLRTTKDEAEHGAEMHEFYRKAAEMNEQPAEEETPADVELDVALKEVGVE